MKRKLIFAITLMASGAITRCTYGFIMPFGGATLRMPQVAGWGNAMRWLLDRAVAIAQRVASCAPLAVQATRTNSMTMVECGAGAAYAALMEPARAPMSTDDAAEGVRSFIERRDAVFTGR